MRPPLTSTYIPPPPARKTRMLKLSQWKRAARRRGEGPVGTINPFMLTSRKMDSPLVIVKAARNSPAGVSGAEGDASALPPSMLLAAVGAGVRRTTERQILAAPPWGQGLPPSAQSSPSMDAWLSAEPLYFAKDLSASSASGEPRRLEGAHQSAGVFSSLSDAWEGGGGENKNLRISLKHISRLCDMPRPTQTLGPVKQSLKRTSNI